MMRIFTPFWIIFYLAITPIIGLKYSADFMLAFLEDEVFIHLDKCTEESVAACLPSTFGG